jgi:serine/threonine protein kinase
MRTELSPGTVLGGFCVESFIAEGPMGPVYLASHAKTGRQVALKLLAPELSGGALSRRRFLREPHVEANVDHPHIVPVITSGEDEGVLYVATAYVEGSDLRALIEREGRLDPDRALNLLEQVAAGLDAAHAAGLVHRDLKPGNILVSDEPDGEKAYVCDFGVESSGGHFIGTTNYLYPEQIEGGSINHRADVYALGCVLFECLAGEPPFHRESEFEIAVAHLEEEPPRLSDLRPDLPAAFDDVVATGLAKSPGDRYSTCGELVEAARDAQRGHAAQDLG